MSKTLVLITGASRGFGREIALAMLSEGVVTHDDGEFVICARTPKGLKETYEMLQKPQGTVVNCVMTDFSSPDVEVTADLLIGQIMFDASRYKHAYLFNNAGTLGKLVPCTEFRTISKT